MRDTTKLEVSGEQLVPIQIFVPRYLRKVAKAQLAQEEKTWADLLVPHIMAYVELDTNE